MDPHTMDTKLEKLPDQKIKLTPKSRYNLNSGVVCFAWPMSSDLYVRAAVRVLLDYLAFDDESPLTKKISTVVQWVSPKQRPQNELAAIAFVGVEDEMIETVVEKVFEETLASAELDVERIRYGFRWCTS